MDREKGSGSADKTSPSFQNADQKKPSIASDPFDDANAHELHGIAKEFYTLFKQASRRWEMIIYPAILGSFIMFGVFFAIFFMIIINIQSVVEKADIGTQMTQVSKNLADLTDNIRFMTGDIKKMRLSILSMNEKMDDIKYMKVMSEDIALMNQNMHQMNQNMGQMRWDFSVLNRNVSKPMSMMNSFMPW